ncbi:pyrroline-5-carboxylate reductase [Brooklawnia cerclae]|uniref:Pyrroline-5-carboxylate reductase n=1 Tax=Brooklawnia cerclae TaxID=349934 RepID=A0ABX0SJP1_9ACTN|nr:pyrroline-5-carboxylate reductase dimerization domain-containing protein [Brooklawnia cerclae]NIH58617.1 pyrroline-5-carboxylate reductase [Brooklawnia cerclae]
MTTNLYFVGGGNMAEAIIAAVASRRTGFPIGTIHVEDVRPERVSLLAEKYGVLPAGPVDRPDAGIVVIAVRPQDDLVGVGRSVAERFGADTVVVSIVAGYTIKQLEQVLGADRPIVRIIPNTLTTTDYGYSGVALGAHATQESVEGFLSTFGKTLYVDESLIDVITGFYPPNIVYHFVDALIDAGVLAGLPRDIATKIAIDNIVGGINLLTSEDVLPQVLLHRNNSPAGVGINLQYELERGGFAAVIHTAVLRAVARTTELGRGE